VHRTHFLVSPTTGCRSPTPRSRRGAASCAHGRRHRYLLATLSRFPLQWTRLLPRPHVAVSVTPGKARMLAHQAEWSLLSGRDGILDRSRNGQVRRSSREARRQRDGGHEQQESTPQRRSSARRRRAASTHSLPGRNRIGRPSNQVERQMEPKDKWNQKANMNGTERQMEPKLKANGTEINGKGNQKANGTKEQGGPSWSPTLRLFPRHIEAGCSAHTKGDQLDLKP
jgi:hypothetical protein